MFFTGRHKQKIARLKICGDPIIEKLATSRYNDVNFITIMGLLPIHLIGLINLNDQGAVFKKGKKGLWVGLQFL